MNKSLNTNIRYRCQRGAILIAVLAILITLTLLGITGMRSTTLEERMVGNFQEKYLAFQAAERAARIGEEQLDNAIARADMGFDSSDGTFNVTEEGGSVDPFAVFTDGTPVISVDMGEGYAEGTRYIIERLPIKVLARSSIVTGFDRQAPEYQAYRVTARGVGRSGETEVIIQTHWVQ